MAVCHSTSMSSDTPPSRAGSLLQWNVGICKRLVGCQAAFASRLAPTFGLRTSVRDWSAVRPPSRASLAPTRIQRTAFDSHHSSGRALARLQLLILIHPPLSGG